MTMSSSPPASPRLQSLAEFGGDVEDYIKHVEQYRQYTELKAGVEKVKRTLLTHKPQRPPAPETALEWTVKVPYNISPAPELSPVKPVYIAPQEEKMSHPQSNKPSFMDMDSYNMDDKVFDIKDSEKNSEELDVFIEYESTSSQTIQIVF